MERSSKLTGSAIIPRWDWPRGSGPPPESFAERINAGTEPAPPAAPHPRSALTLGGLIDKYETVRTKEGGRDRSLPEAMGSLRRNLKRCLPYPPPNSQRPTSAPPETRPRGKRADRREPAVGLPRSVHAMGGRGRLISQNFVSVCAARPRPSANETHRSRDQRDLVRLRQLGCRVAAKNYGRMVKFLLVTAQRRDERPGCTWRHTERPVEADREQATGRIASRCRGWPSIWSERARRGNWLCRPDRKDLRILEIEGGARRGIGTSGWALHDLRRTAASEMQDWASAQNHRGDSQPRGVRASVASTSAMKF